MDLLALLRQRGNDATVPPPTLSDTFVPRIRFDEEHLPAPIEPPSDAHPLGRAFGLRYEAADGEISERRVTVHYAYERNGTFYLQCYCHERKTTRCFRADRIISLIDRETGEVLDDRNSILACVRELVNPANVSDATLSAFHTHRPSIIVLLFLSRCDGEHPLEIDVILNFLDHFTPRGIDEKLLRRKLRGLHPDPAAYERALNALEHMPDELDHVARAAVRLVDADGVITEEETYFAIELKRHVDKAHARS